MYKVALKRTLLRTRKNILNCNLLIIDELEYLLVDLEGAELLFYYHSDFYETKSLIVTMNLECNTWNNFFEPASINQ